MSKQIWEGFAFGALLFFLPAGLFYAVYRAANYPKIDGDSNLS